MVLPKLVVSAYMRREREGKEGEERGREREGEGEREGRREREKTSMNDILEFVCTVKPGGSDVGRSSPIVQPQSHDSSATEEIVAYGCSAVQGFFRSIALSVESSLQDTLRCVVL